MDSDETLSVLHRASAAAGVNSDGVEVIRLAENAIYRLRGGVVARISRTGQSLTAAKEVNVARWLQDSDVPAVRVIPDIEQPVHVDGRTVTFWHKLPPHHYGTTADVAASLRALHKLPQPDAFELPELAPFVRLAQRIESANTISVDDQNWLLGRLGDLQAAYDDLPLGLPRCVVHGDAWSGNVVVTADGVILLLDLERCSIGPPEWDLVSTAVSYVTTAKIDTEEWTAYCETYGYDVTSWEGFEVLRDIRELRQTTMAVQVAATDPERYAYQAAHRLACLRGQRGPRPWSGWRAVP